MAPKAVEETEVEEVEPYKHPEPTPVGHRVVQDNVSEPGTQITHEVDEEGEVLATSTHSEEDAAQASAPEPEDDEATIADAEDDGSAVDDEPEAEQPEAAEDVGDGDKPEDPA